MKKFICVVRYKLVLNNKNIRMYFMKNVFNQIFNKRP